MDQHRSERMILRVAAVLIAISIILVAIAFAKINQATWKIVVLGIAALPFCLAAFLIHLVILSHRARKGDHNYFLYDRSLKKNMPPEQLTAVHVSDCLVRYMSLFRQGKQLYISSLFDEAGGVPEVFKPLFCYQLLQMMSICTDTAQWNAFWEGGKELADVFSTYLLQANEVELSRNLQFYMAQADVKSLESFRQYLSSQSTYLSSRMLEYTKDHIHEFD